MELGFRIGTRSWQLLKANPPHAITLGKYYGVVTRHPSKRALKAFFGISVLWVYLPAAHVALSLFFVRVAFACFKLVAQGLLGLVFEVGAGLDKHLSQMRFQCPPNSCGSGEGLLVTTVLYTGPSLSFHDDLREGTVILLMSC